MPAPIIKALIVVTSHPTLGATGKPTGYYLPEVTHPYAALVERGIQVDIASIDGGEAPLDLASLRLEDPVNAAFWNDLPTRAKLTKTLKLADLDPRAYQAILFAGGHGTMWDFRGNAAVQAVTSAIYDRGGVVAAVCHGPAALVDVTLANGQFLVAGKDVAGFSDAEEKALKLEAVVPFLLETELVARGARYTKADLWQPHVVVDGRLVTGQNPASAAGVGEATARVLTAK